MPQVHGRRRRTTARIQVEWTRPRWLLRFHIRFHSTPLLFRRRIHSVPRLQQLTNLFNITMTKKDLPPQEPVQSIHGPLFHRHILQTFEEVGCQRLGTEFVNEFVVVDVTRNFKGGYHHFILLVIFFSGCSGGSDWCFISSGDGLQRQLLPIQFIIHPLLVTNLLRHALCQIQCGNCITRSLLRCHAPTVLTTFTLGKDAELDIYLALLLIANDIGLILWIVSQYFQRPQLRQRHERCTVNHSQREGFVVLV
mmetsp:Transcript_10822/g.23786  ORF Transcript_10822/g.23786 Transcript_10822/m.23786 type:complete len:252 (-) Transcript_10822:44-799(-)